MDVEASFDIDNKKEFEFCESSGIQDCFPANFFLDNPLGAALFSDDGWCIKINKKFSADFNVKPESIEGGNKYNILNDKAFDNKTIEKLGCVFDKLDGFQGDCAFYAGRSKILNYSSGKRNITWFRIISFRAELPGMRGVFISFEDITFKKDYEYKLLQQINELKILNDIILTTGKSTSADSLIRDTVNKLCELFNFDFGAFYSMTGGTTAELQYSSRKDDVFTKYLGILNFEEFPFTDVLKNKSAVFYDNFSLVNPEVSVNLSIKSLGIIPMQAKGNIYGGILVCNTTRHNFSETKKKVLLSIGHELGALFEKLNYESELRHSEARYKDIFDNSALGIYQSMPNGEIISVNPAFARMFRFEGTLDALERINEKSMELYINDDVRSRLFDNVSNSSSGTYVVETELKKNDKSTFIGKIIMRSVKDNSGIIQYYEGFIEDVTERKTAEARMKILNIELERRVKERTILLEAANKELESFAYSVSHDLRAPLRAIDGFSLAILEDYGAILDATAMEYLGRVRKASQRMSQLIDDILILSRVTRTEMEPKYFNISVMVEEIFERLAAGYPKRKIRLETTPGLVVFADQRLLSIALENLIDNALKFTDKKDDAEITFGTESNSESREYFIKDNGEGFDMKYYDKLFGPFQRLHSPEEFPGTGIGLATVKRILQRHGGSIRAESITGKGACFYFTLADRKSVV